MQGDVAAQQAVTSEGELAEENHRLRLQLAEARRESHFWRVHVQGIAESRSVITARVMSELFARMAPPGSWRRRFMGHVAEGAMWLRRRGHPAPSYATRRYRQYYLHAKPGPAQLRSRAAALAYLDLHPVVSAVVVADQPGLERTVASILAQIYDRTEIVVAATWPVKLDPTVVCVTEDGGFEALANAGAARSSGEFLVVLRAGDLLEPNAICDLVTALQDGSDAAYADEDRYDEDGEHLDGHLKPARFGPETCFSYDVVGSPLLVRTSLYNELGGLDASCAPVAGHDLVLRLTERTDKLAHVAAVLLSRPLQATVDPFDATAATIPVVARALARRGATAVVGAGDVLPSVRYTVAPPTPHPSVAIVIPTRDRLDLLRACLDSVERRTTYENYSIVICDNDSVEDETLAFFATTRHKVVPCPGPFNYAAIVNKGVASTTAEFVVTLNNDTTIATPDWLERLVGLCSLDRVGSVGVKLQYPDGRLQHEGVGIIPMPVPLSRDVNYHEVDRWLTSTRDAAAVTGACQMVRTDLWHAHGGLDEKLAVAFNDIDFGMRLCASGWRVVYTPEVVLGHRESASRGDLHPPADEALLIARWDLLGEYLDPSMPPAVRFYTTKVELDVPAPGR